MPCWPDQTFAERARETVGWLMREMRVAEAFAASLDADQEGEEGAFYVWRAEEIDAALGEAAQRFKAAYDIRPGGNWEGRTVLRRIAPRASADEERDLAASREKLFALRETRAKPGRDDKILSDWNGLMIAALARASAVFDEPKWFADARSAFYFVFTNSKRARPRVAARLAGRTPRRARPTRRLCGDGARGARAVRGERRSRRARRGPALASEALDLFGDGAGGVYLTASNAADVPGARPRHAHDGATPSGVGLLLEVFAKLWHLTNEARWREAADGLIRAFSGAPEGLGGSPLLVMGADTLERGGAVVVDGPLEDPLAQALAGVALEAPDPSLTVFRLDRGRWPKGSPRDDLPRAAGPVAMLCRGQSCSLPVATPEALKALMQARN